MSAQTARGLKRNDGVTRDQREIGCQRPGKLHKREPNTAISLLTPQQRLTLSHVKLAVGQMIRAWSLYS